MVSGCLAMEEIMPAYGFYLLDEAGRLNDYRVVECSTDADACRLATTHLSGEPAVEIWQNRRKIAHIRMPQVVEAKAA